MTSETNTLVASIDSEIGKALKDYLLERSETVHGTSRLGVGDFHLELTEPFQLKSNIQYDRLFFTISAEAPKTAAAVFQVNCIRTYEFLNYAVVSGLLKPGAQIVVLTSQHGSITEVNSDQSPWYRMSKAALNMGVKLLSKKHPGFQWICLHPGLVDTRMTKTLKYTHEKLSPRESASSIIKFVNTLPTFGFYDAITGRRIPW